MKKGLTVFIKITVIILAVIALAFATICAYAYLCEKKSDEYAKNMWLNTSRVKIPLIC